MDKSKEMVTIFQDTLVPEFVIRLKDGDAGLNLRKPTLESHFYMMLSSKSEKLTKFWLQLIDGRIYMRNAPDGQLLAYIDIAYARIKLLKAAQVLGKTVFGIRFIKNKNYEEIYHQDNEMIQTWYSLLKKYCVMSKFRELYKIENMIGKGNFAKVYVTKRMEDQQSFAVKIFDKKLIVQDKFERVPSGHQGLSPVRAENDERSNSSEFARGVGNIRRRQQYLLFGQAVFGRKFELANQ